MANHNGWRLDMKFCKNCKKRKNKLLRVTIQCVKLVRYSIQTLLEDQQKVAKTSNKLAMNVCTDECASVNLTFSLASSNRPLSEDKQPNTAEWWSNVKTSKVSNGYCQVMWNLLEFWRRQLTIRKWQHIKKIMNFNQNNWE